MRFAAALLLLAACAGRCSAAPLLDYSVVARYPHPETPFTQGFEIDGDTVYESSGLYRRSFIARWKLGDAHLTQKQPLPPELFAEGLTVLDGRIYTLSWRERRALVFDRTSLRRIAEFEYGGEGWGLAHNGRELVMSDGSDTLRFLDPANFRTVRTLAVTDAGQPVGRLNELEWIPARGDRPPRVLANIWQTDTVVAIDPASGAVTAQLDLGRLYTLRSARADVLNGIAYDARDDTLLLTGKFWPYVYRVRLSGALRY